MSNYTQTTFFAPKDLLASGNPSKVIYGAQVDPELNAIAIAIATKYDAASVAAATQILFANGSAAAPSISFNSYPNTGVYVAGANSLGFSANGVAAGSISNAGNWTIPAPGSGVALTASGAAAYPVANFIGANNASSFTQWQNSGTRLGFVGAASSVISGGSATDFSITALTNLVFGVNNGTSAMNIATAGNVTVSAPSSGVALTLNGAAASNVLIMNAAVGAVGVINTTNANGGYLTWQNSGVAIGDVGAALANIGVGTASDMSVNARGSNSLYLATNTVSRVQISGTGAVTINAPTSGIPLQVNNDHVSGNGIRFNDTNASPQSYDIGLGVGSAAASLVVYDRTNTVARMSFTGTTAATAAISGYGPNAAGAVDMTPDTGTFTGTLTGTTGSPACRWVRYGKVVQLTIGAASGAASGTTMTMTGLPSAIQPATTQIVPVGAGSFVNNGTVAASGCAAQVTASSGTVTFWLAGATTGFTAANTKGINSACTVTYHLF